MYSHLLDDGLVDDLPQQLGCVRIDEPFVDRSLFVESWDVTGGMGVSFGSLFYFFLCVCGCMSVSCFHFYRTFTLLRVCKRKSDFSKLELTFDLFLLSTSFAFNP